MKNLKKIAITLLVLFMLVPSFAFANSVEETPELKAKIENIVKTMPEDDAIEAIEELVGLDEDSLIRTWESRDVSNFAIYKMDDEGLSKSRYAFTNESYIESKEGFVYITLKTQPMSYKKHNADVTKVFVIGDKTEYEGINSDFRSPSTKIKGEQVPGTILIKVPVSEIKPGKHGYNSLLKVRFETNLRNDFGGFIGKLFPDAMINPKALFYFNNNI